MTAKIDLRDLVLRAQKNDRVAMNELVKRFWKAVYHTAFRVLKCPSTSADIAQDTFVAMSRKIHTLREPGGFSRWLLLTATRLATNYKTNKFNRHEFQFHIDDEDKEMVHKIYDYRERSAEESAIAAEEKEVLHSLVGDLAGASREAITDFHFDGLTVIQIMAKRQIVEATAKRRTCVARQRLRAMAEAEDLVQEFC